MKIALISADASPVDPGDGRTADDRGLELVDLAMALAAAGHEVDVFVRQEDVWSSPLVELATNVQVRRIAAGPPRAVAVDALFPYLDDFAARFVDACLAYRGRHDVVHAASCLSGIAALRLKKVCGVPFAATIDDLEAVCPRPSCAAAAFAAERVHLARRLAATADRLIAPDTGVRDALIAFHSVDPPRIEVIPSGIDTAVYAPASKAARFHFGLRTDDFVVVQSVRHLARSGIDTAIRAIACLKREHGVGARLVVTHERASADPVPGGEIRRLRVIATTEGVASQLTFVEATSHAVLRDAYASADVVLAAPSRGGCVRSPLEALACGAPVIGTDVGTIRHALEDEVTGFVVPPDDVAAVTERLARLQHNPELARAYGRAGIRGVRARYTWRHAATALARAYAAMLEPHRARLAATVSHAPPRTDWHLQAASDGRNGERSPG